MKKLLTKENTIHPCQTCTENDCENPHSIGHRNYFLKITGNRPLCFIKTAVFATYMPSIDDGRISKGQSCLNGVMK